MKKAFTLAEVLITLGIIGVVAAITLPTLIANYQKKVLETQYKVAVTTLSQAFGEWAENDDMLLYNNNPWTEIPTHSWISVRAIVNKELMNKYFKGELTWNGKILQKNQIHTLNLTPNQILQTLELIMYIH